MSNLPALHNPPAHRSSVTPVTTQTITGWPDEVLHTIGRHYRAGTLAYRDPDAVSLPDGRVSVGITVVSPPDCPVDVVQWRGRRGRDRRQAVFAVVVFLLVVLVLVWAHFWDVAGGIG